MLISFAVTAKSLFSHDAAHMILLCRSYSRCRDDRRNGYRDYSREREREIERQEREMERKQLQELRKKEKEDEKRQQNVSLNYSSIASCSKLTSLLVNISLKFEA